jgi:hypothetical protein
MRVRLLSCATALALALAGPALAGGKQLGGGKVSLAGVPENGSTLTVKGAPAGATCSINWDTAGGTQRSTSCTSYAVSGDNGHALVLTVTAAGKTAYAVLAITGSPGTTATVGNAYSFTPGSSGGSGGNVFGVAALPPGASFATSTGALTWSSPVAGTYPGITISVGDSVGGSASLAPYTITVSAGGGVSSQFFFPDGQDLILAAATL